MPASLLKFYTSEHVELGSALYDDNSNTSSSMSRVIHIPEGARIFSISRVINNEDDSAIPSSTTPARPAKRQRSPSPCFFRASSRNILGQPASPTLQIDNNRG